MLDRSQGGRSTLPTAQTHHVRRGEKVLYEAGDPLLLDEAWPAHLEPGAAEDGIRPQSAYIDGDSAVVLEEIVNSLQGNLGIAYAAPFVKTSPATGTVLPEERVAHLLRFFVRAAGPTFAKYLSQDGLSSAERDELLELVTRTEFGTSVARDARNKEEALQTRLRAEEADRAARAAALQKRAEAEVASELKAEHTARVAERVAALKAS